MKKHRKDMIAVAQDEHNSDINAKRVQMVETEIELTLIADEDTVSARAMNYMSECKANQEVKSCNFKEFMVYLISCEENLKKNYELEVSPLDQGDVWFRIATLSTDRKKNGVTATQPMKCFSRRLRLRGEDSKDTKFVVLGKGL